MPVHAHFSLILVVSIAVVQIGSAFVCPKPGYPIPICLTVESSFQYHNDGWSNARNFYLAFSHEDCQVPLNQKCCAHWAAYGDPTPWQLREYVGLAVWCKHMDPKDQCVDEDPPVPMPYRKRKRFDAGGGGLPKVFNPNCYYVTDDNGNKEGLGPLAETGRDSIDDNQNTDFWSLPA